MRKITTTLLGTMALMMASGAHADGHEGEEEAEGGVGGTYTMEGTLSNTKLYGGVGPDGGDFVAASWDEAVTIAFGSEGETVSIKVSCGGMENHDGALFDRHVSCNASSDDGGAGAMVMGCSVENDTGNEMSCVGYFQGKEGGVKDQRSMITAYYTFDMEGNGTMYGSGTWIR